MEGIAIIIILVVGVLVVMGVQNWIADLGRKRDEEQIKAGRGMQKFGVICLGLVAFFVWAGTQGKSSGSGRSSGGVTGSSAGSGPATVSSPPATAGVFLGDTPTVATTPPATSSEEARAAELVAPPTVVPPLPGERFVEIRIRPLAPQDVEAWNQYKVQYAINETYARYGFAFRKSELREHFGQFSWYRPDPRQTMEAIDLQMTEIERANIQLLGELRKQR